MSFNRAPIKRFNETTDRSIPPPGAYDPKFMTDVAISSSPKPNADKWRVTSNSPARPPHPGVNHLRSRSTSKGALIDGPPVHRNTSRFTFRKQVGDSIRTQRGSDHQLAPRHSSATGLANGNDTMADACPRRGSTTRVPVRSFSKPPSAAPETQVVKRSPSSIPKQFAYALQDEGIWSRPTTNESMPIGDNPNEGSCGEVGHLVKSPSDSLTSIEKRLISSPNPKTTGSIFDEIENLAESLQSELADYKINLGQEIVRSQELEAKKIELEYTTSSYKRQLERLEVQQEIWEMTEKAHRETVDDIMRQKQESEEKQKQLEEQLQDLENDIKNLEIKLSLQEEEKCKWEDDVGEYNARITSLQRRLRDEELKRTEVEARIISLELQIETTYRTCEIRLAENETAKEKYEVQIEELKEEVKQLQTKLEEKERELDTQRTLMDILKAEKTEGVQVLADRIEQDVEKEPHKQVEDCKHDVDAYFS